MLACVVQVYFDQFLPTDASWPEVFGIENGRYKVFVAPRRDGEDLYREDIDRTMSTMGFTLTRLGSARPVAEVSGLVALARIDPDRRAVPSGVP